MIAPAGFVGTGSENTCLCLCSGRSGCSGLGGEDPADEPPFVHNRWAMTSDEAMKKRVGSIRELVEGDLKSQYEAAALATAVLYDTVGGSHPLAAALRNALEKSDSTSGVAAASAVVRLYDEGRLQSPRLAIAHEIEGSLL